MHGRVSGKVRAFAIYGDTTGESDEFGLPVRLNWAADYRARASVVAAFCNPGGCFVTFASS